MRSNFEFESDWKLFSRRIADWQERYMLGLLQEYARVISEDVSAADRFWKLEERINRDKNLTGVVICKSRSSMFRDIIELIDEGAINYGDLDGFSDEFVALVKRHYDRVKDVTYPGTYERRYHG